MEKVQSMISVMELLGRNYIRQTTGNRGNAVVEKSPVQNFQIICNTHLPKDITKCLQEMLVQSVAMEQTHDTHFHAHQN